jgi:hypothetical protein
MVEAFRDPESHKAAAIAMRFAYARLPPGQSSSLDSLYCQLRTTAIAVVHQALEPDASEAAEILCDAFNEFERESLLFHFTELWNCIYACRDVEDYAEIENIPDLASLRKRDHLESEVDCTGRQDSPAGSIVGERTAATDSSGKRSKAPSRDASKEELVRRVLERRHVEGSEAVKFKPFKTRELAAACGTSESGKLRVSESTVRRILNDLFTANRYYKKTVREGVVAFRLAKGLREAVGAVGTVDPTILAETLTTDRRIIRPVRSGKSRSADDE